jgi:hypothetical protein
LGTAAGLYAAATIARPSWPVEFLQGTRSLHQAAVASPSLWGLNLIPWWIVVPVGLVLIYFARDRWAATLAVNPAINGYNLLILIRQKRWWLIPLSWVLHILANQFGTVMPSVLMSLIAAFDKPRRVTPSRAIGSTDAELAPLSLKSSAQTKGES